jgi:glycosyltransferase involved in cell wall biosynthesis
MEVVVNGRFLTQGITGVQRYARELVQALDVLLDSEPEVRIAVLSPRISDAPPNWRNIELRQVGYLHGHAWEQIELPWYSRDKTLFCPGNTAPVISLLGTQRVVVTVHDLSYKYFPEAYRPAFRLWYGFIVPLVLRRAQSVITVSETERRKIIAHYPTTAPRLNAIANGGLPSSLSNAATSLAQRGDNCILYVGSLSKRKNFPRLLDAACQLARRRGFNFVFVGDASKSLAATTVEIPADIASRIRFVGALDDTAALISYYRTATCFIFPSLYESSGLPPIEAMACGCPVIVSDIPALRERCGDAALYCNPQEVDSIVAGIERIMNDVQLRSQLMTLGYQRAQTFTWERCARQTFDLLCESSQRSRPLLSCI